MPDLWPSLRLQNQLSPLLGLSGSFTEVYRWCLLGNRAITAAWLNWFAIRPRVCDGTLLVLAFGSWPSFRGLIFILQKNAEKAVVSWAEHLVWSPFDLFHDLYLAQFEWKAAPGSACSPKLICIGGVSNLRTSPSFTTLKRKTQRSPQRSSFPKSELSLFHPLSLKLTTLTYRLL